MLTNDDLGQISKILEQKLEEKLEQKLDEKLDQKFDEKLEPINKTINSINKTLNTAQKSIKRIEKTQKVMLKFFDSENVNTKKRVDKLENAVKTIAPHLMVD